MCDDEYCEGHDGQIPQDDERWLEIVEELSVQHPIPEDLARMIADQIEPVTENMGVDHGDVMVAIDTAFPVILNYFDRIDLDGDKIRYNARDF
jgi:hypothetical protein